MKGDFTRDTFRISQHFSRVLRQQGRVTLDADPNEQTSILLHYLRTLAQDLIGAHGAPARDGGFILSADSDGGILIGTGRYYVNGVLVENDVEGTTYLSQPDYPVPDDDALRSQILEPAGEDFWVYLDVWERHITPIEDDYIREKALMGPHTCTRAKVVWQLKGLVSEGLDESRSRTRTILANRRRDRARLVREREAQSDPERIAEIDAGILAIDELQAESCIAPLSDLVRISDASLAARVDPGRQFEDPCETAPDAKYRGTENQLYRVEIHRSGEAGVATFKWSRDNGSVAAAWLGTTGNDLRVAGARGFSAGTWVELFNDVLELQGRPGTLVKLANVEGDILSVDPDSVPAADTLAWGEELANPKVRRWDQMGNEDILLEEGAVPIREVSAAGDPVWIDLEDGVQVQFSPGGQYRSGDYWLIPARVATGDIEWPEGDPPPTLPPHGVLHHYAPIGFATWRNEGMEFTSCRCVFDSMAVCNSF
jgi:hypothetical protein